LQTPAKFEYTRATSLEDAISTLQRLGGDARIVAGGHSLLPMMKLRLANPGHLIDINDLDELSYIRVEGDEIRIGALTRHVELLKSDLLARHFPLFADAEEVIADPVVRNRGTIGGSLCQADAAEDLSAVCSAVKAQAVIRGAGGERLVGMEEFHIGPYVTAVGDGEMLTEVRIPLRSGGGSAHEKVERRAGDWAIAAASAALWLDNGKIVDAGIALSAVGLTTIHVTRAEELLRGKAPSAELFAQAGSIASKDCSPSSDGRGPVDYKRHLAGVLTQRALIRAAERAAASPSRPYPTPNPPSAPTEPAAPPEPAASEPAATAAPADAPAVLKWGARSSAEPAASEPVAVSEPAPEPVAVSEPAPEPVAVSEPAPEPVAVSEPEPEPVAVSEPEPEAVSEPEPEAVSEPEPVAVSEPEPVAASEPVAVSEPAAAAAPAEGPTVLRWGSRAAAAPTQAPEPPAVSEPAPEPEAVSEPEAASEPETAAVSEPETAAVSEPEAVSDPEPEAPADSSTLRWRSGGERRNSPPATGEPTAIRWRRGSHEDRGPRSLH
jgi:carbon-monoxide dehydrogenase medium subunit